MKKFLYSLLNIILDFNRYRYFEIIPEDGVIYREKIKKNNVFNYKFSHEMFGNKYKAISSWEYYN